MELIRRQNLKMVQKLIVVDCATKLGSILRILKKKLDIRVLSYKFLKWILENKNL